MAAVTARTKRESPKIDLAGVETGAKIFVGLRVGEVWAAETADQKRTRTGTCRLLELFVCI